MLLKECKTMSIIKRITEFKWDLSKKGFNNTIRSFVSLFTEEKKLVKWVYLYTFILVPLLNWGILSLTKYYPQSEIFLLWTHIPSVVYSPTNIILMSILIAFTTFTFIITLRTFKRVKPFLFASSFTQILVLFFEINIIRKYAIYYNDNMELGYLSLILCLISLLFAGIQLLKIIYKRIRASVISRREVKIS
jgi:succinate-acetate transporter protein